MSEHSKDIEEHTRKIEQMEKIQIVLCEDVKHIKSRIDNGVSATITKIWDKLNGMSDIKKTVDEHEFWISKIKWAFIWLGVIGVLGGGLGITIAIVKNGI